VTVRIGEAYSLGTVHEPCAVGGCASWADVWVTVDLGRDVEVTVPVCIDDYHYLHKEFDTLPLVSSAPTSGGAFGVPDRAAVPSVPPGR
jgi:hypothetical protein